MQNSNPRWLVVLFREELTLAVSESTVSGRFFVDEVEYSSPDENFLTAFYDRLVDARQELGGIRIHPATDVATELLGTLQARAYLGIYEGYYDLYLSARGRRDIECMGDQAFGGQVFSSANGDIALSLDLDGLCSSVEDLRAIRAAQAVWATIK